MSVLIRKFGISWNANEDIDFGSISIASPTIYVDGKYIFDFRLLHSDFTKLALIPNKGNGSVALEMDTSKVFLYDEVNDDWKNL